jgi:hypothetical protein
VNARSHADHDCDRYAEELGREDDDEVEPEFDDWLGEAVQRRARQNLAQITADTFRIKAIREAMVCDLSDASVAWTDSTMAVLS